VSLQRRVGEDVGDDVAEAAHGRTLLRPGRTTTARAYLGLRRARHPRPGREGRARRAGLAAAAERDGPEASEAARRGARGPASRRPPLQSAPPRARDGRGDRDRRRPRGRHRRATRTGGDGRGRARRRRGPRRHRRRRRSRARPRGGLPRADRRRTPARDRRVRRGRAVTAAVRVHGLRKRYGEYEAVRGIDFEIRAGEVFGLLGPNGAGKTTTVEVLEGYRARDGGEVEVLGEDPQRAGRAWRERVGVVLQSSSLYPGLTVRESLRLFAGYYTRPRDVGEVARIVGLDEKVDAPVRNPELVFLDEPTTGFDPGARRAAWETIRNLRSLGTTILLTTHYLDEAEQLADRVAVLRAGEIVRVGSPAELTGESPETEIRYRVDGREIVERTGDATRRLHELTGEALARGESLDGLEVRRPTLEEIYLELTGE